MINERFLRILLFLTAVFAGIALANWIVWVMR